VRLQFGYEVPSGDSVPAGQHVEQFVQVLDERPAGRQAAVGRELLIVAPRPAHDLDPRLQLAPEEPLRRTRTVKLVR
jgi:hypothetical protein